MIKVLGPEETIRRADIQTGHNVLDLGCGSGRITIPAAEKVGPNGKVLAMDLQKGMISKLDKKLRSASIDNIETRQADLDELVFGNEQFDRIILVMLIGELKHPERLFEKLKLILKADGMVSVSEVFPDPHYQSKSRIIKLAKSTGFEIQEEFFSLLALTINLSITKEN